MWVVGGWLLYYLVCDCIEVVVVVMCGGCVVVCWIGE